VGLIGRYAAVAAVSLMPYPALAQSASDFDGTWVGTLGAPDSGDCGSSAVPVHAMLVENGRLRSYSFMTHNGPLPVTGGFVTNGRFDARGFQPGKGTVSLAGKVDGGRLRGRWSIESGRAYSCSGTFAFERD
jgi:hypothetical protein